MSEEGTQKLLKIIGLFHKCYLAQLIRKGNT